MAMEWDSSFELDNIVSTPSDAGFPFHSPPPDLPPVHSSHMNIDQPQSQQGDLRPSVVAMESEISFELENFVSTPSEGELPLPPPSSDLPPVQSSHRNIADQRKLAAAQSWKPPDLYSNPTDHGLVENLRSVIQPSRSRLGIWGKRNPAVVNADLPSMNPSELPGMEAGKHQKCYLTDHHQLCSLLTPQIETTTGYWTKKGLGSTIWTQPTNPWRIWGDVIGFKTTYIWQARIGVGTLKSKWIMNVYRVVNKSNLEDELALCHVFEDQGAKPKLPTCDNGGCRCNGKHHHEGVNASTNTSPNSHLIHRESSPMHHGAIRSRDPRFTSYLAMYTEVLLGEGDPDPDPDSSTETGHYIPTRDVSPVDDRGKSHKRKKISVVWDYFTKIYAHDLEGNVVTLAACNHCSNVLTADSKSGTTHLARHTCPCKFKPVDAGRKDKGVVNVLSSQATSSYA